MERDGDSRDQAVVLTLRKRYSVIRRDVRDFVNDGVSISSSPLSLPFGIGLSTSTSTHGQRIDEPTAPSSWQNTVEVNPGADRPQTFLHRPSPEHSQSTPALLNHRLSFDHATGVIMLPEDGEWLLQEDSDSEEAADTRQQVLHQDDSDGDNTPELTTGTPGRHRTYYHHPERRRQTIPGAFP